MNLIFRKIDETNAKDIDQFNELMDDLTEHAKNRTLLIDNIRKMNNREDAYLMVAEDTDAGKLCGSVLAIVFDDFCDDCKPLMLIENVVTHHDYQHKGVGKRMFEEMEAWGSAHNVNYASLCSSLSREGAHKFYHAIGYKEVKGFKKFL